MKTKYFVYRVGQKQAAIFKSFKKAQEFASGQIYKEDDLIYIDECLSHGVYNLGYMTHFKGQNHFVQTVLGQLPND